MIDLKLDKIDRDDDKFYSEMQNKKNLKEDLRKVKQER